MLPSPPLPAAPPPRAETLARSTEALASLDIQHLSPATTDDCGRQPVDARTHTTRAATSAQRARAVLATRAAARARIDGGVCTEAAANGDGR